MLSKIIALNLHQAYFNVSRGVCFKTVVNMEKKSLLKLLGLISVLLVARELEQPFVDSLIVGLRTLVINIQGFNSGHIRA